MKASTVTASIIIRTYNEERCLYECLDKVFKQTGESFEVIVVDSESTDNTVNIAKQFDVKLVSIPKKEFTYGRSLNVGCSAAKGEYLIFLSAHALPASNFWLSTLLRPLKEGAVGVYGKQLPATDANPLVTRFVTKTWNTKKSIEFIAFSNANAAIKREFWKQIRFDENTSGGEDRLWARKIKHLGHAIKYSKEASVYHSHNDSLNQLYKRYLQDLTSDVALHGFPIIFVHINNIFFNFAADVVYIVRRSESPMWIFYSLLTHTIKLVAFFKCGVSYIFLPRKYSKNNILETPEHKAE